MTYFVAPDSIVRKIWGKSDTILFIFAGAAAEFALNKAVDWLYYTGKLPADPLGRLFSTVSYARKIIFASREEATKAIESMRQIHTVVEQNRGASIPDWAYRDVLFMLIEYSITSYELLEQTLNNEEKEEVYQVFYQVGTLMGIKELPPTYADCLPVRAVHLLENLQRSTYTADLFKQYKYHLGTPRYLILLEVQKLVVPVRVKKRLGFSTFAVLAPAIPVYKLCRLLRWDSFLKSLLLPADYKARVLELDVLVV